jgi:hypothetical protein
MRRRRFQLVSVGQRVLNQIGNVPIRQCVEQMRAFATAGDEPFTAQEPKPLTHGRELVVQGRDDFGDAQFPLPQHVENSQARRVAESAIKLRGPLKRRGPHRRRLAVLMIFRPAGWTRFLDEAPRVSLFH